MGVFGRSWEITKITFSVMKKEKELFLFPILAIIFSIVFVIAVLFPTIIIYFINGESVLFGTFEYVLIFATYFGLAFIATFFNVCVVSTAATAFSGQPAKFSKTIGFAFSKIHLIFLWSLVSASVGLLFRIIENIAEKMKGVGKLILIIVNSLFGLAWSIATIFIIPAMVYHNTGPFAGMKRSIMTLKKTWGEYLVKVAGMGVTIFLFILLGIVFGIGIVYLGLMAGLIWLIAGIALCCLYFLVIILLFGVANQIFDTALYVYAETGSVPSPYTQEIMQSAFKSTKK